MSTLFPLGQTVITANAKDVLHPEDIAHAMNRHTSGDWGELGDHDRDENNLSLRQGFRLFSVYLDRTGRKFWIITEADRSVTTILLPEDY
jgi:hypothetical protein